VLDFFSSFASFFRFFSFSPSFSPDFSAYCGIFLQGRRSVLADLVILFISGRQSLQGKLLVFQGNLVVLRYRGHSLYL
jgi:hypothetical protein